MLLCNEIHMLMQYYGKEPFYASFSQADTPSLGGGLGWVSVSLNILFSSSHSLPWGGLGWVSLPLPWGGLGWLSGPHFSTCFITP